MTKRTYSPLHDFWHRKIEGQIRDCMNGHPDWFRVRDQMHREQIVNSLAKRIVGEIIAEIAAGDGGNTV